MKSYLKTFLQAMGLGSVVALISAIIWDATSQPAAQLRLRDLADVRSPAPSNGQALLYNSTLAKWTNGTVSTGSGGTVGLADFDQNQFLTNGAVRIKSGAIMTNITVEGSESVTNGNLYVGPGITINGTTSNVDITGRGTFGSLTMNTATASTLAVFNALNQLASLGNGVGLLTNNGSGGVGWATNIAQAVTYNNFTSTNITAVTINNETNIFTVGKGGKLTVNTTFTLLPAGPSAMLRTDSSTNVVAATIGGGLNFDGTTLAIKRKNYLVLAFPHNCDGAGAIIFTNDNTKAYFGQAAFSGSAATNANYIEYRITVPEDIDTSVDLKVERWKVRLGAADTSAQSYNIAMASVADSAGYDSPTLGQWVAINIGADASGASGDVETVSNVTLTSWKSNVTAGQLWVIRVNRDGAGDASTQISYSGPLIISYTSTQ